MQLTKYCKPHGQQPKNVDKLLVVVVPLTAFSAFAPEIYAVPPLENGVSFPAGSFVIPMDEKQADRIQVYGFVHPLLRDPNPIQLFRVIEPPDITLSTSLTTSAKSFAGGPFLVNAGDAAKLVEVKSRHDFENVTVGTLSADHVADNIFRVSEPTRILVVSGEPAWGRTDITLQLIAKHGEKNVLKTQWEIMGKRMILMERFTLDPPDYWIWETHMLSVDMIHDFRLEEIRDGRIVMTIRSDATRRGFKSGVISLMIGWFVRKMMIDEWNCADKMFRLV